MYQGIINRKPNTVKFVKVKNVHYSYLDLCFRAVGNTLNNEVQNVKRLFLQFVLVNQFSSEFFLRLYILLHTSYLKINFSYLLLLSMFHWYLIFVFFHLFSTDTRAL
jgi:hypothetical protein